MTIDTTVQPESNIFRSLSNEHQHVTTGAMVDPTDISQLAQHAERPTVDPNFVATPDSTPTKQGEPSSIYDCIGPSHVSTYFG